MSRRALATRFVLPVTAIAAGLIGAGFLPLPQPRPQVEPERPLRLRPAEPATDAADDATGDRIATGFALFEPFAGQVAALPPRALRPAIEPEPVPPPAEPRATGFGTPTAGDAAASVTTDLPPAGVLGYAADPTTSAHAALGRLFVSEPPSAVVAAAAGVRPEPVPSVEAAATPLPAAPAGAVRVVSLTPPAALPIPAPGRVAIHVPLPKIRPLPPLAPAEVEESEAADLPAPLPIVLPRPRPSLPPTRVASLGRQPDASLATDAEVEADVGVAAEAEGVAPAGPRTLGEPKRIPSQAMPYIHILRREAKANGVPLWLAVGVGWVESRYQPKLKGSHGVLGLMQVMPATARFQGYRGTTEGLLDAETNIVWGMRELGWAWKRSGGDVCLTVAKYKGGIMTTSVSSSAADYCRTVREVTGMNRLG